MLKAYEIETKLFTISNSYSHWVVCCTVDVIVTLAMVLTYPICKC